MAKLTEAQKGALKDINAVGGKSGRFWLDLGTPMAALRALERKELVVSRPVGHRAESKNCQFWITEAGRAALAKEDGHG